MEKSLKEKERLGRPKSRWEGNIKLDLKDMGRGGTCTGFGLVQCKAKRWAVVQKGMNHRSL